MKLFLLDISETPGHDVRPRTWSRLVLILCVKVLDFNNFHCRPLLRMREFLGDLESLQKEIKYQQLSLSRFVFPITTAQKHLALSG